MKLTEQDWLFINNTVYKLYAEKNFEAMREGFLQSLRLAVDFDRASFYLAARGGNHYLSKPVGINFTPEQLNTYIEEYEDLDYLKSITTSPQSYVYRESDLFSPEFKEGTTYYQLAHKPLKIQYTAIIGFVYEGNFLGTIALYRHSGKTDFSERDLDILNLLKNHVTLRLQQEYELSAEGGDGRLKLDPALRKVCDRYGLTQREGEVLALLYAGDTSGEICEKLFVAATTLKKHITNIYKKLGISSRTELFKIFQS